MGDLVRSVSGGDALALIIGFKQLYEGCGNRYPIIMWLDSQEVDSCSHRRVEVVSESR